MPHRSPTARPSIHVRILAGFMVFFMFTLAVVGFAVVNVVLIIAGIAGMGGWIYPLVAEMSVREGQ